MSVLPRILFMFVLTAAAALILLVIAAPLLDNGASRVLALFAQDATLRRTAAASALGLAVTAFIFFRPPRPGLAPPTRRQKPTGSPPPPSIAGA